MAVSSVHDPNILPEDLPVPEDDGAADHLPGMLLPPISLPTTGGDAVDISGLPGLRLREPPRSDLTPRNSF
jgi:hypothetical protein